MQPDDEVQPARRCFVDITVDRQDPSDGKQQAARGLHEGDFKCGVWPHKKNKPGSYYLVEGLHNTTNSEMAEDWLPVMKTFMAEIQAAVKAINAGDVKTVLSKR